MVSYHITYINVYYSILAKSDIEVHFLLQSCICNFFFGQLCWVAKSQVINRKMNDKQTSAMIKSAATNTSDRKRKIMDAVCIAFYPVASLCCRLNYLYFLQLYWGFLAFWIFAVYLTVYIIWLGQELGTCCLSCCCVLCWFYYSWGQ
jgi:hypothetical protein